ncbi:Vps54-domain-containing protein [Histomonas meleagridis]|uniref:Vps54-domain-containing protein n=1 Tax=Histomonas meleagridis TaxID=135588 RepID=UPI0035596971|nr:Vps54-domain-containing protein [Histomonas meleagridis]KAH0806320.1 Vps54-domain-containing protein [Histomonas meleagridis]
MELKYPVQPFVFEFAKQASKTIGFKDISIKPAPHVDLLPIEKYLENNGPSLDELSSGGQNDKNPSLVSIQKCKINPIFFDPNFDLKNAKIFAKVFTKDCIKHRLFSENLVIQLDTVQSLLFHSSDSQAYEFFRSFSTIHDMHSQISILIPRIKETRRKLLNLQNLSNSTQVISQLCTKKERLCQLKDTVESMKKVISSPQTALLLADNGDFNGAFSLIDETTKLLTDSLLGIKSIRPYLQKLKTCYSTIESKVKNAFNKLFLGETSYPNIIQVLKEHNLVDSAIEELTEFVKQYAKDSVEQLLCESAEQKGFDKTKLRSLPFKDFTEVLTIGFPNIRTRILIKANDSLTNISKLFHENGIDDKNLSNVSVALPDTMFKEAANIILSHSLKGATLDDFGSMFEAMISFGRGFEKFDVNKSLLQSSLHSLGRSFIENFHCEQSLRLSQTLVNEKWVKKKPEHAHIEIIKKLTTTDVNALVINNEHYESTNSLLVLLEVTWNYLQAARRIPRTADDVTKKLAETIKLFNSQSHDLLLKGGSLQTAKMKSISTKNLAISASGLSFYVKLIPYIKPRLVVVGASQEIVDSQLNEAAKLLSQHYQTLVNKILDVLAFIIQKKCEKAEFDQNKVSPFVAAIASEVLTLNKMIGECLPKDVTNMIFANIAQHIVANLSKLLKANGAKVEKIALGPVYYRKSNAAIAVFDLTKKETMKSLEGWIETFRQNSDDPFVVIAGNKSDLDDKISVSIEETAEWASSLEANCIWTSAKTGDGIEDVFNQIMEHIFQSQENTVANESVDLTAKRETSGGCCS